MKNFVSIQQDLWTGKIPYVMINSHSRYVDIQRRYPVKYSVKYPVKYSVKYSARNLARYPEVYLAR